MKKVRIKRRMKEDQRKKGEELRWLPRRESTGSPREGPAQDPVSGQTYVILYDSKHRLPAGTLRPGSKGGGTEVEAVCICVSEGQ